MNEYEATIQINPTDDIKFILEEPGCYESEIEMMKAGGTYDAFVKRVYDATMMPSTGLICLSVLLRWKTKPSRQLSTNCLIA